jgi:tetratricopeptide (TPR) repeat protein
LVEAEIRWTLGWTLLEIGRADLALAQFLRTRELRTAKLGPDHPDTLRSMNNLAVSYAALGRHADALKLREETLALRKAKLGPDHPDTLQSMFNLGLSHIELKNYQAAEASFLDLQARGEKNAKNLPAGWQVIAIPHLVRLYDAWGKPDEAEKWFARLPAEEKIGVALERQHAWPVLWGWPRF